MRATRDEFHPGHPDPNKAGFFERHHITPKYMGGAKNGPCAEIDAAYHQKITNAFMRQWNYGQKVRPTSEEVQEVMRRVYDQWPLPRQP